jgi:hypothetical protein
MHHQESVASTQVGEVQRHSAQSSSIASYGHRLDFAEESYLYSGTQADVYSLEGEHELAVSETVVTNEESHMSSHARRQPWCQ